MRKQTLIACVAVLAAAGTLAPLARAADTGSSHPECAKVAARYEAAARGKKGTNAWMAAEYWATEARAYCETGHPRDGVEAYEKALERIRSG